MAQQAFSLSATRLNCAFVVPAPASRPHSIACIPPLARQLRAQHVKLIHSPTCTCCAPACALSIHIPQLAFHHWRANFSHKAVEGEAAKPQPLFKAPWSREDKLEPIEGIGLICFNKHLQVGYCRRPASRVCGLW